MSDLKRWYQYDPQDGEPIMCIAPKVDRVRKSVFIIRLADAFRFTDPQFIRYYAFQMCERLDLGLLTMQRFSNVRSFIEDGLDELVAMKPCEAVYDDKPKVVGEGTLLEDGVKTLCFDVTDDIYEGEACGN